jgi:hypothetical protein
VIGRADAERPEGVALGRTVEGDDPVVGEDPPPAERELGVLDLRGGRLRRGLRLVPAAAIGRADRDAGDGGDGREHAERNEAAAAIDVD